MAYSRTIRQQEIVKGARKVIFSKGIERLTTREIAQQLKLTNGALYRHFKSKDQIICLLIDDIEENLLSAIQEAANKDTGPLEKLESVFLSHLSYSEQLKGTSFTVINQVSGLKNKALKGKMLTVLHKYLRTIQGIVAHGVKSGVFRKDLNPVSASIVFFGTIQSLVTLWCLGGYKPSLKQTHCRETLGILRSWLIDK